MAVTYNNPFGINSALYGALNPKPGLPTNQKAAQFVANTTQQPAFSYTKPGYVQPGAALGATTPPSSNTNTGGNQSAWQAAGHPGIAPVGYGGESAPTSDPYASVRNDISSAWDNYLNSLGGTAGYLDEQRGAQENIAQSQYNQGLNTVNTQKASSLKDIHNTARNAFQAGNNYLGSLGAGDSSAANQYTYAITQQANKQTGDLNNYVGSQIQSLQSTRDQQINTIASWFAQQQAQLKQQIAQGQLSKGQDLANLSKGILDKAMAAKNQVVEDSQNRYNALLSWAASNSQNLGQLQQNIAGIPQAMGQLNTFGGSGGGPPQIYGGAPINKQKTDIFGNPVN